MPYNNKNDTHTHTLHKFKQVKRRPHNTHTHDNELIQAWFVSRITKIAIWGWVDKSNWEELSSRFVCLCMRAQDLVAIWNCAQIVRPQALPFCAPSFPFSLARVQCVMASLMSLVSSRNVWQAQLCYRAFEWVPVGRRQIQWVQLS